MKYILTLVSLFSNEWWADECVRNWKGRYWWWLHKQSDINHRKSIRNAQKWYVCVTRACHRFGFDHVVDGTRGSGRCGINEDLDSGTWPMLSAVCSLSFLRARKGVRRVLRPCAALGASLHIWALQRGIVHLLVCDTSAQGNDESDLITPSLRTFSSFCGYVLWQLEDAEHIYLHRVPSSPLSFLFLFATSSIFILSTLSTTMVRHVVGWRQSDVGEPPGRRQDSLPVSWGKDLITMYHAWGDLTLPGMSTRYIVWNAPPPSLMRVWGHNFFFLTSSTSFKCEDGCFFFAFQTGGGIWDFRIWGLLVCRVIGRLIVFLYCFLRKMGSGRSVE